MARPPGCDRGQNPPCEDCRRCRKRAAQARWRDGAAEEVAAYARDYYAAHKPEYLARSRTWNQSHRDEHNAYNRAYRADQKRLRARTAK